MQVDTVELRSTAGRLRDGSAEKLRTASIRLRQPGQELSLEAAFDTYTTAEPLRAATGVWSTELELLTAAIRQLADALEAAASDYDRADSHAAVHLGAPRNSAAR
ncbi:MAG: hypothetical protein QOC94_1284 [Actinoplanes sp.]|jgi:hypothetical protein|nr:hypothetical protein [Actinoplanes sp.]